MDTGQNGTYPFEELKSLIKGDLLFDETSLQVYSTDASAYSERPLGIALPRDVRDVASIVKFASQYKIPVIPRTAGTSLAGQVVGAGLVVDIGRYMNKILEVNADERWVRVEPGVVLDELNQHLKQFGLFFGPETSTSSRCMIGGMVGNNSCGAHSLIYGSTRDHTLELKGFLSNGDEVHFKPLQKWEFESKCRQEDYEGEIYSQLRDVLTNKENRKAIRKEYPHPEIHRRNTGYALDILMESLPFDEDTSPFNICKLIAGSEGTLMFATEIKLNLIDVPPKEKGLVCVHLNSLEDALKANLVALQFNPGAIELMDKTIMDLTKDNPLQNKNRFFVQGDPEALLLVEFARESKAEIDELATQLTQALKEKDFGYAYPVLHGQEIGRVWSLRKAGLGVLSNMPGDDLPVPVIEDTAVRPVDLPDYIADIKEVLEKYGKECVYYAHVGTGELHLRPVLNMKRHEDVQMFHDIALDVTRVVKKYKGSLSGEHGDGRLRGEFIPLMVGEHNYDLFKVVKQIFDPAGILNPGKITDTPRMNSSLRYKSAKKEVISDPLFDWSKTKGMVRAAERCNGSGDCRKSHLIGGTMCPSYMGSHDERQTTRARANMLREFFTGGIPHTKLGFDEVKSVLDLCLSCKACKTECPSNVDMTKLKAEFLQEYHHRFGTPFRNKLIGRLPILNRFFMIWPSLYNIGIGLKFSKKIAESGFGFSSKRSLPSIHSNSLRKWTKTFKPTPSNKNIFLFADEFTNYNDTLIGIKSILLFDKLGYGVRVPHHFDSGRTYLSKGLLKEAEKFAVRNVLALSEVVGDDNPLVGIEPSAILTIRDEYLELVPSYLKEKALYLAKHTYTFEEFMAKENDAGAIDKTLFVEEERNIRFHAHCYQKALSDTSLTKKVLEIPGKYTADEIPSGCCGMAGSFGYEKEHYDLSMKIGELVLFPDVREHKDESMIVAAGTSCRHQIKDGTNVEALHPAEVLYEALK
ncbi:FAD-binding and (Fe-S)-binding domain-containing protein [Carboxylicivirga linearis]|uniref:FAD-binding protein n=1 Tax=Carboxylicivirga linearis TaxID=1628157 RepID=A0ABS5JTY3_9BACT|nr:FAD-binding and (Fe-S)-binding domain-containing protein [Carboxylicivirga linearis]MBS2097826.1 FAD-binding protein [Carboxylicivirga linearis]